MEAFVHGLIDAANGVLCNDVLIALLLGAGAWFTLRFRMIQLKAPFLSMKRGGSKGEPGGISSFQAFPTGLASHVGTGNIAGVAVALTVGGPGAIFRIWTTALGGMSSAFVPELAHVLPADVWGEHRPLPQRAASADAVAEARVAVRES